MPTLANMLRLSYEDCDALGSWRGPLTTAAKNIRAPPSMRSSVCYAGDKHESAADVRPVSLPALEVAVDSRAGVVRETEVALRKQALSVESLAHQVLSCNWEATIPWPAFSTSAKQASKASNTYEATEVLAQTSRPFVATSGDPDADSISESLDDASEDDGPRELAPSDPR